jgi:hypothetical protein
MMAQDRQMIAQDRQLCNYGGLRPSSSIYMYVFSILAQGRHIGLVGGLRRPPYLYDWRTWVSSLRKHGDNKPVDNFLQLNPSPVQTGVLRPFKSPLSAVKIFRVFATIRNTHNFNRLVRFWWDSNVPALNLLRSSANQPLTTLVSFIAFFAEGTIHATIFENRKRSSKRTVGRLCFNFDQMCGGTCAAPATTYHCACAVDCRKWHTWMTWVPPMGHPPVGNVERDISLCTKFYCAILPIDVAK